MSEEQDNNKSLSANSGNNDTINTPSSVDQPDDRKNSSSEGSQSTGTHRAIDPMRDTTVFSPNDRRLKRILNHQNDDNPGTVALGDKQEIILLIRGMAERIVLEVGQIHQLGRFEIGSSTTHETDLTPYGARDRGVSRIHAELKIIDGVVHIVDLDSTNGTFVNTHQLEPDVPVPLRKGDELLLGRLAMQILFR